MLRPRRRIRAGKISADCGFIEEAGRRKVNGDDSAQQKSKSTFVSFAPRQDNPIVFLDISVGGQHVGRIVIELRADIVPKASENFRLLCVSQAKGLGSRGSYRGSIVHRIVSDFGLQGGDVTSGNGTGRGSAFGPPFHDENFTLRHTGPGCVSCVCQGPDMNGSQFLITTVAAPWLDTKRVVFGCVMGQASLEILSKIERMCGTPHGEPLERTQITDCGQLYPPLKKTGISFQ
jgi:cyclophilin family peptidyl-prolyl cis-trans isomerase